MVFFNKNFNYKNKLFTFTNNLNYTIDFMFFIMLIKEYIKLHNLYSVENIKISVYLLNLIAIKFNFYITYIKLYKINNTKLFKIYNTELLYWQFKKIYINNLKSKSILQKILLIKKISRTRAKGRVKRYKVVIIIGNKSGWFGIGYSKNYYLQEAISKARLHAFKNIFQISMFYSSLLKNNINIHKNSKKIYLFSSKFKPKCSSNYVLRVLFEFIGITNVSSKIIGINNIHKILSKLLNL